MTSLSFKLNAFDEIPGANLTGSTTHNFLPNNTITNNFPLNNPNFNDLVKLVKKSNSNKDPSSDFRYKYIREEEIKNDSSCTHCPKYLLLTEQINKAVEKIAKDPKYNVSDELPVKINRLKFLYYTQALHDQDGKIKCQRLMDITPDLRPTKFDGQFKLIAEEALTFSSVSEIQYMNPNLDEVVYYYRGEGTEKNIVVQAILTKDGGKFRYYRYIPSDLESNPYNLPDMDNVDSPPKSSKSIALDLLAPDVPKAPATGDVGGTPDSFNLKIKTELETRNKYIPKNVHFMKAEVDQPIAGGISVKGSSDTSIKGNLANLSLKNGNTDLVVIDLNTKLNGSTDHRIVVPYAVHSLESFPDVALNGKVQLENNSNVVMMSLTDKSIEFLRTEFRRNNTNNKDSYVLARDIKIGTSEVVSMQLGKDEADKRYASLKHVKSLKDNITLVLDVRVDNEKKVSLFYQVSAKF